MKLIMYLSSGDRVIGDLVRVTERLERETQWEYERRVAQDLNRSQPYAVNKIVKCRILRN